MAKKSKYVYACSVNSIPAEFDWKQVKGIVETLGFKYSTSNPFNQARSIAMQIGQQFRRNIHPLGNGIVRIEFHYTLKKTFAARKEQTVYIFRKLA